MKTIIEKLIVNYFGSFIKGIESDKLSVSLFSGNFQLENISLNSQFFDKLNTPYKLSYSSIGKLNLQAPLSKLATTPVECVLDNIYAVFELKQNESFAENDDYHIFLEKKQSFQKYIKEMYDTFLKKVREKDQKKKEDGMMAKLGKKIVDNLQLKIVNVHFRFEEKSTFKNYSWGVTLDEISFITTDKNWNPSFIDRSGDINKNQRLYKKMNLKKLNLYWNSMKKQDFFITNLNDEQSRKTQMLKLIGKQENSIFSLTSEAKLVINPVQDPQTPLYELSINLDPIKFELERKQVLQMIDFAEKNIIRNEQMLKNLSLKKKKTSKEKQMGLKKQYEQFYLDYIQYVLAVKNNSPIEEIMLLKFRENEESMSHLKKMFSLLESEELMFWSLKKIRNSVKIERQKQLKKQKKGWFGGDYELNEDEEKNLRKFVEEEIQYEKTERPRQFLFFSLKTVINGGHFSFIDYKNSPEEERIEFKIGQIDALLAKSMNDAILKLAVEVQNISLDLLLPHYDKKQKVKMNILANQKKNKKGQDKFLSLKYQKNVSHQDKPIIETAIKGQLKKIIVTYKKNYMKKLKSFFTFENINENIKKNTIKRWEQITEKKQGFETQLESQEEKKIEKYFDIQLNVFSPTMICPLGEQDCWCLNLGELRIKTDRSNDEQIYPMKITSAFFRYYPQIQFCFEDLSENKVGKNFFSVINNIDFTIIHTVSSLSKNVKTEIFLPNFEINFNENQYYRLITLKNIFKIEDNEKNFLDSLKKQRYEVEQKKQYEGSIQKKNESLGTWKGYYGILSGEFIYLYGSQKQVKCLQKISIKNSRVEFIEEENILVLINQHGFVNEFKNNQIDENILTWKKQIQNQMKEYMTLFQIVENLEQKQENSKKKKKTQVSNSSQIIQKSRVIEVKVHKIGFRYQNEKGEELINFQIKDLAYKEKQKNHLQEVIREIKLSELSAVDYLFKYQDPMRQSLIIIKNIHFLMTKDKFKNVQIDLQIPQTLINWKPDVLVILFRLMKKHLSKEKVHRVDDDQDKNRQQLFDEVLNDRKYVFALKQYERNSKNKKVKDKRQDYVKKNKFVREVVKLNVRIKNTQVFMIHRQSHLTMFKLTTKNIENQLILGENQKFVSGKIQSFELFETMGYPKRQYSDSTFLKEFKIASKKNLQSSDSVIIYKWSSYNPYSFPNIQKIDSFLHVLVNPIKCVYFQQITFRLIDYMLIQVILLLNQPEMLIANENLLQQLHRRSIGQKYQMENPVKILFSEYEEVIKRIVNPYFTDMFFKLIQPVIEIRSQKNSDLYYEAQFEELIFKNRQNKSGKRFQDCECPQVKKFIYEEEYIITGQKCSFKTILKDRVEPLFEPVKVHLVFNKLLLEDEINVIYPEINKYDRSFKLQNTMSKLRIMKCTRQQYLNINKLVNFNFVFDDNHDELFIHNFKITKLLSPKPIQYQLLIPSIEMSAKQGTEDDYWDLFTVNIQAFKLSYERNADLNSKFQIWMGNTTVQGFQYSLEKQKCAHRSQLVNIEGNKKSQYCGDIVIRMKTTGEKIIEANIQNIEVHLKLHLLQLIFQWSLMEDWVFPTVSLYANDITFFATIHNLSGLLQEDSDLNMLPRAFRFLGFLCFKFHRKKNYSQQCLEEMLSNKKINSSEIDQMPEILYMSVLINTEVHHCLASLQKNVKRKVVEKFTLNMVEKRYFRVANEELSIIKTAVNRKFNFDKCLLKISFTDSDLIRRILTKIQREINYMQRFRKIVKKNLPVQLKVKETQLSTLDKVDVESESFSVYLINNCRSNFIPVLRFNLSAISINKCKTSKKDILKMNLDLSISYFNASIFRWQPILQGTQIHFHQLLYFLEDQAINNSSLEAIKPINLNISKEMFISMRQIMKQWQQQKQKSEQQKQVKQMIESSQKKDQLQSIEFVAKYAIRNETGYPIEVFNHEKKLIHQIKSNEEVDYRYQVDGYNEDKDIGILIGINIMHPKYKFQRMTHIPIDIDREFSVTPLIIDYDLKKTTNILPINSYIVFHPEVKDSKKRLILKSSKRIENYIDNRFICNILPFDHPDELTLIEKPHNGITVSLYKRRIEEKYRYQGEGGVLKIKTKYLVYNYTPIPLLICNFYVFPGDFASISQPLTIQNLKYRDCQPLKVESSEKKKEYYITCQGYIVDYYGLYFELGYDTPLFSHEVVHNSKRFTIYLLPDVESKFKVRLNKKYRSTSNYQASSILKPIVGTHIFSLEDPKGSLYEFSIHGSLERFSFYPNSDFKKIIEITPAYVISNATKFHIKICQISSCESVTLQPFQRVPFFWESKKKPKQIKIAILDGNQMWGYSGPLKLNQSIQSFVLRNASNIGQYKLMSTQIQNTDTINFIHLIENDVKSESNIILSNQVEGIALRFFQSCIFQKDSQIINPYECYFKVGTQEEVPFGYELPLQKHEIIMQVDIHPDHPKYKGGYISPVNLNEIQSNLFDRHIYIYKSQKRFKKLYLRLIFEGNVKKLKLLEEDENQYEENKNEFLAKIPSLGISLIGYKEETRKELAFFLVQGFSFERTITNSFTQYQVMIQNFRIENQLHYKVIFPTILFQIKQNEFFLNFILTKDNKNSKLIHYIGLSINNFSLSITSEEMQYLQENMNEMLRVWQEQAEEAEKKIIKDYSFFKKGKPISEGNLYFVEAEIHPLRCIVTFKHVNNWGGRVLKTFSSIDDCKISVDGKRITHFSCKNISQFSKHVLKHYEAGIYKMLIPLIGNLSILGSPVSLAQRIGSGFKDLIQLPSEGFARNPLEGGKGLAKGAGSLMKNTFEGAFNSAESISGSVGNGISSLAFDEEFSKERQKIKNEKSEHIGTGLLNGAKSLANGVGRGVAGVITSPVEGAQENGIGGFFLGGLKGITGLVVKPVSGLFDATTKTFQGIKNTPGFIKQIGSQNESKGKIRHPRIFYTYSREIRTYDKQLALCAKILTECDEKVFQDLSWYSFYYLESKTADKNPVIFLTYEHFVIYNLKAGKIINSYRTEDIYRAMAKSRHELKIKIYDRKRKQMGKIEFNLRDGQAKTLQVELNNICEHYRPIYGFNYQLVTP